MDTAEIRRIPTSQLVARAYPGFKATKILEVLDKLAWKSPLILKGPKGCLAGDTEIIINRGGKSTRITIKELFHKFHGGTSRGRSWDPDMITHAQIRDANGCGSLGVIEDVVESGVKKTFTLTTAESASTIRATAKHLFWTKKGWVPLGELEVGMEVSRMAPPARRPHEPENLEPMLIEDHLRLHALLEGGSYKNVLWHERWETIESIEPYGEEPTYDICMASEPHNFTANGFVVHNSGKTLNIEQWAHTRKVPFLRKSCTADTSDRQLLGSHTLKSFDESFFTLGCLAAAIDVANEAGRCVLVLEEINALNEEAQKVVNGIADYRKEVDLPHIGQVFRLAEAVVSPVSGKIVELEDLDEYSCSLVVEASDGTLGLAAKVPIVLLRPQVKLGAEVKAGQVLADRPQLWVVGTMNPGYGGTYDLNEDFRSRFKFIEVDFMDDATELEILLAKFPTKATADEELFVKDLRALAKESRGGKYGYALSTRDLEQCIEDLLAFRDRSLALKMLEGKFDAQHVSDFRARVKSTTKLDITTTSFWS